MTPQNQEFLHNPEAGINGDCFRACIASLLDLPIAEVPHFCNSETWFTDTQRFLSEKGYDYPGGWEVSENPGIETFAGVDGYYIGSGPSPRFPDAHHAVICKAGQVIFDPHPDKTGILELKYIDCITRL